MSGTELCLDVYLGCDKIAQLSSIDDHLKWAYTAQWCQEGYPVSPHLPLSEDIPSVNTNRFLQNMFPEGGALDELIKCFHLAKGNTFGLAKALGLDMPGSLVIVPKNQPLPKEGNFRELSNDELIERLDHREDFNLIIWDGKPRLSVAGVQDKINVNFDKKGQMGFSEGALCSTHILKFEKLKLSYLVLNEYITMQLASLCGLEVAHVQMKHFDHHATLLVERFDRKQSGKWVKRRHMIDGCQALNLPPHYKYERNFGSGRDVSHIREGASYPQLFEFANHCIKPALTKQKILDWALFNLLVFNHDAHGKNISFFISAKGIELAPFYDLLNIKMYKDFEQEMAMAVGDEFNPNDVHAYQLADFAESCQLPRALVATRLKRLISKLISAIPIALNEKHHAKAQREYIDQYYKTVKERCANMLEQLGEIMSIEL